MMPSDVISLKEKKVDCNSLTLTTNGPEMGLVAKDL